MSKKGVKEGVRYPPMTKASNQHQMEFNCKVRDVFLSSRFMRKDAMFSTGDLFSLGVLVFTRFLVVSVLKAGRSRHFLTK